MNTYGILEPTYSQKIAELARLDRLSKATDNSPEARQARLDQMAYDKDQNSQLKRLLQRQNGSSANVQQDKFTGISDGILGYAQGVASDRANPPPSQPVTAYGVGSATGDTVNSAGRALYDAAGNIIPPVLDTFADTVEGGTNFLRGAVGMGEMEEGKRFREGDDFNPFNYKGVLGIDQDSSQADLSALEKYRPDGILANAQDIDMGGKGVLRPDEPNTHTMPDGTVMEGATHEEYEQANPPTNPVLNPVETSNEPAPNKNGILQNIGEAISANDGTGSATNNSRSNTATAEEIRAKKLADSRRNEMLIRVGGAIAGGARQGGLSAMSAGAQEYGNIQDYNREQERLQYEDDLARDQELRKQQASQANADADRFGSPAEIYAARELSGKLDGLLADLSNSEYNAVGATKNWLTNKVGGMMGTDEASIRLRLQELVVDKTLSNTAFTKGAISDKEMALFRSDIPQFSDSEKVWLKWLNEYQAATRMLERNLRTGYAPFKEQNARGGGSVDDLLSKYD